MVSHEPGRESGSLQGSGAEKKKIRNETQRKDDKLA